MGGAGTLPLFTGTADAASTWGASAAEKGRCFGAAVGTYKFSGNTCMSVLNRQSNSVVAENEKLIRAGNDQTVPLTPCTLQFLCKGHGEAGERGFPGATAGA